MPGVIIKTGIVGTLPYLPVIAFGVTEGLNFELKTGN
jgi:hypothetical protein